MSDLSEYSDEELLASLPRGVRNNNPLNLKVKGTRGQDGDFGVFNSWDEGMAAADRNLQAYGTKHGINTLSGVINRWAPPNADGNNTAAYIAHVAKRTGIDPEARIDLVNPQTRAALLGAMGEFENGAAIAPAGGSDDLSEFSDEELLASLKPAGPLPKPKPRAASTSAPARTRTDAQDAAAGLASGTGKGIAGMADATLQGPLGSFFGALQTAGNLAGMMQGQGPGKGAAPLASVSEIAARNGYTPETRLGRFAETVGTMLPNGLIPAGALQRAANVALPAFGNEGAQQLAEGLGLDERGQQIAGIVGSVLGGGAASARVQPRVRLPTGDLEALRVTDKANWAKVDASKAMFSAKDSKAMVDDVARIVADADPDLYPKARLWADKISRMAARGELTLGKLNTLKSQMWKQLSATDEAGVGEMMRNRVEALINTSNDPSLAAARESYKRVKKFEEVTNRVDSAHLARETAGTGGNGNTVRQKLRPLIDPKSPQRATNLTKDEAAALKTVVKGSPAQNMLRLATAFDPTAGRLQALLVGPGALATGGINLALAPFGMAARAGERAIENRNVQHLLDLIAAGGKAPPKAPAKPYAGAAAVTAPLLVATPAAASQRKPKPKASR